MVTNNDLSVESTTPKWLHYFTSAVKGSDSFIQEMNRQLGRQFTDLTGLDLEAGFELSNPFPESFQIVKIDGASSIEGDLVGKRMGYRVKLSWKSVADGRNIQPNAEIGPDDVHFWWSCLDAAEIIEEETKKAELYFNTSTLSFEIDNEIIVWPHLSIDLYFKEQLPENAIPYFQELLLNAQTDWNQNKEWGVIHQIREVEVVDERCLNLKIDFGSAAQEGLEFILHLLDKSEKGIAKVRMGSY